LLSSLHLGTHFLQGLKEKVGKDKIVCWILIVTLYQLIEDPKVVSIYHTHPPFTSNIFDDMVGHLRPTLRKDFPLYPIIVLSFLWKNIFLALVSSFLYYLSHGRPIGNLGTLVMEASSTMISKPLTSVMYS
jgi:hypothetical protein